jgi:hypothetical protein
MLGRAGEVLGVYDKLCPVAQQFDYATFEGGVTPGRPEDCRVFELDFGPVGVQICFDLGFEENWRALAACLARVGRDGFANEKPAELAQGGEILGALILRNTKNRRYVHSGSRFSRDLCATS